MDDQFLKVFNDRSEIKPRAPVTMTSDKAMKTLGLQQTVAGAGGKISKTLRDYSEEDITQAFQSESLKLGKLTQ